MRVGMLWRKRDLQLRGEESQPTITTWIIDCPAHVQVKALMEMLIAFSS